MDNGKEILAAIQSLDIAVKGDKTIPGDLGLVGEVSAFSEKLNQVVTDTIVNTKSITWIWRLLGPVILGIIGGALWIIRSSLTG